MTEALRNLVALIDCDAQANKANFAEILLDEDEVIAAKKALGITTSHTAP